MKWEMRKILVVEQGQSVDKVENYLSNLNGDAAVYAVYHAVLGDGDDVNMNDDNDNDGDGDDSSEWSDSDGSWRPSEHESVESGMEDSDEEIENHYNIECGKWTGDSFTPYYAFVQDLFGDTCYM